MVDTFSNDFWFYLGTGFGAQLIGSTLGMGNGTVTSMVLLACGFPPVAASATSNTASSVSTLASSWFQLKAGNVEKRTFWPLTIAGVIGAIGGAWLLTSLPLNIIRPTVGFYLLTLAFYIVYKALRHSEQRAMPPKHLFSLGLFGGFLGSMGGGGWGPLVNSHMVAYGHSPRHAIGSSNAAKAVATLVSAITLIALAGGCNLLAVSGLIIGGLLAAPLAAISLKKLPARATMMLMALLLIGLSTKMTEQCWTDGKTYLSARTQQSIK